jgi:hypothetical protein
MTNGDIMTAGSCERTSGTDRRSISDRRGTVASGRAAACLLLILLLFLTFIGFSGGTRDVSAQTVTARPGAVDGSWLWVLPDTPNGLRPTQSWHATGSTPSGNIYVGGMDHATNSALYRIRPGTGVLRYVGDAKSASEDADNLHPDETFEKFHTRPTWIGGKVHVATMDYSKIDAGYLGRRGSHLYAFDPAAAKLTDLSAAQPGGLVAPHVSVVNLAADPARKVLYEAAVPTGEILRYDLMKKETTNLGRPARYDAAHLYVGRFMWVDSRGNLYFTAGNTAYVPTYDPAIYQHIHFYKPGSGFGERTTWRLEATRAIETGQCIFAGAVCYLSDDQSRIYRFTDRGPSWTYIGQVTNKNEMVWVFHVAADGKKAYVVTTQSAAPDSIPTLYEYDLRTRTTRRLCAINDIDPAFVGYDRHTGYNAWDRQGRFYFASFPSARSPLFGKVNVRVTAIDPIRLKAALDP